MSTTKPEPATGTEVGQTAPDFELRGRERTTVAPIGPSRQSCSVGLLSQGRDTSLHQADVQHA